MLVLLFLSCLIPLSLQVCSWDNCNQWSNDPKILNIHLVTHTHDDMGWLKTVDEYYWGSKQNIVNVGVQYIYDTVIAELEKSPNRRFSFAETGFFYRWWMTNSDADRQRIIKLTQNGQLEWIGGGWTQNDEAAEHYVDAIDQMTYGLKKLNKIFGECGKPRVAWQIDPFGHSREMANIFSQIGYTSLFFWRIHYLDKQQRLANKTLEFNWSGSDDYTSNILTGAFFQDNYNPPDGFCFDMRCNAKFFDEPIMDNPDLEGYNLDAKIADFVAKMKKQHDHLMTNHLLLTMGSDFHYTNANEVFRNLDRLINAINKNESFYGMRLFYSTPSCYTKGIQSANVSWTNKTDDFFPHANAAHSFWTGYYTSRPSFKGMIREASSLLQLAKRLDSLTGLGQDSDDNVDMMSRASALCQHHDAVTGTAKQAVSYDYYKHLDIGFSASDSVVNNFLSSKMAKDAKYAVPKHTMCHTINETVCTVIQNASIYTVTVFNPLAKDVTSVVTFPFYQNQAVILDDQGKDVDFQIFKTFRLPLADHGTKNIAPNELSFTAQVAALGYRTYVVDTTRSKAGEAIKEAIATPVTNGTTIENKFIKLTFDSTGYISSYLDKQTNTTHSFRQQFQYYHGAQYPDPQPSGAYIFRPVDQNPFMLDSPVTIEVVKGSQSQEVRQTISVGNAYQIVRLRKDSPAVEFEWTIGPIPVEKRPVTKEIVTRYIADDIKSEKVFYTDSNGRQMMKRTVGSYPTFKYENTEPTAGNYYPITSRVYIKDNNTQMTVLTDRSHGGSAHPGMIEIMVHRRCFSDDHYGVDEALNEPGVDGKGLIVKGVHHVILGQQKGADSVDRSLALQKFYKPVLAFAPIQNSTDFLAHYNLKFAGLKANLPSMVNLLSLEHWDTNILLVRFENILQTSEGGSTQTVDLGKLFATINVFAIKEVKLGANRDISSNWISQSSNFNITLIPQEIRTFLIQTGASNVINTTTSLKTSTSSSAFSLPILPSIILAILSIYY